MTDVTSSRRTTIRDGGAASDGEDAASRLFAGAGEMRALCRAFDWRATPLGPVHEWPASLRTAVQIAMDAPIAMDVLWGTDHIQIYNDAYRALMGAKHPAGLGQRARDCWPEIWSLGEPMLEGVMGRGESFLFEDAPLVLERSGRPEEGFFTLTFSPIRGDGGAIDGALATVFETTAMVRARGARELERERLLAAQQESAARYRSLFESLDDGFCVVEVMFDEEGRPRDYRFVEGNAAFERQTGLVDAVGHTARELVPDLEEHWFEVYGRVAVTGEPVRFEQGSEPMGRWFSVYAFRVGRPDERQVAILFSDISAARRAERERERLVRALEVERARLVDVIHKAPAFMAVLRGRDYVMELANDAFQQLVGHRDVVGRPLFEAVPEARGQGFEARLLGVLETGEPFVGRGLPVLLQRTRGAPPEERLIDLAYVPLKEADGTATGIIALGTDVTEQVHGRREVERARDRADRLQRLTAALAATTTPEEVAHVVVAQGVEATDAATGILALRVAPPSANDPGVGVLLEHHGVSTAVTDAYSKFSLAAPGPIAECLRDGRVTFVEDGRALRERFSELPHIWDGMGTQAVATVPLAVGEDIVGAMSFSWTRPRELPLADREFFLALARQAAQALDRARLLAAERSARAQAEQARGEAEAANRAKSEFLAVMSHELRTPLNAIAGYAELMELGLRGPITPLQASDLGRIQQSQRHLLGLINQVLNYTRVDAGAVSYAIEDVRVGEALAAAEALVIPQVRARGHTYILGECDQSLVVRADREKVQQVLLNLLTNAIKFTEPGGEVRVACSARDGMAVITIADTGIGIAPEKLAHIFEPFVQVDQRLTRPHEGVGLGLAISRELARGMGGDLVASSVPGEGSAFTLTLPGARRG